MFVFTIVAITTEKHADHGKIGEAYVACWIDRETEKEAISVAHKMIVEDHWQVIRTEGSSSVTEADYDDDDEYLQFYEQALVDKEVLVFHLSPLFPVYHVAHEITSITEDKTANEVMVWISNEMIESEHDPLDPDFWSGDRVTQALAIVRQEIANRGYETGRVLDQHPCSRNDSNDHQQFYDDAEEDGLCLVFIHDQAE